MKKDLESRMREALRPVAPGDEFTRRLMARMGAKVGAAPMVRSVPPTVRPLWWLGGIAASLLIAIGVPQHLRAQREIADGLEARRQVLQALAVTSQKLDLAYEAVKSQSSSLLDAESGA
jgi:hypothetical protein